MPRQRFSQFLSGGKVIVSDDHKVQWQPSTKMTSVDLTAGKHYKIVVEYRQSGAAAGLEIVWHPGAEILLKDALDRVAKADLAVVCLGLNSKLEGEESPLQEPGFEGGDRTTLDLPAGQQELLTKVLALNKPVILVLLNGSAVTLPDLRAGAARHSRGLVSRPGRRNGDCGNADREEQPSRPAAGHFLSIDR